MSSGELYSSEYYSEPHRNEWEQLGEKLKLKLKDRISSWKSTFSKYNVIRWEPSEMYDNLRRVLDACGWKNSKEYRNKKVLIVGTGPGLEVRLANDMGMDAIGVESDSDMTDLGREIGMTSNDRLVNKSLERYLQGSGQKYDAIIGMYQTASDSKWFIETVVSPALNSLKPEGKFFLYGYPLPKMPERIGDFSINTGSVIPKYQSIKAAR